MTTDSGFKAWVVSADMGYGHQRAAYPLRHVAHGGIVVVGRTDASSPGEQQLWTRLLGAYEAFSRARAIPLVGKHIFGILDALLHIPSTYPMRDLSRSTFQVELLAHLVRQGLCGGLLQRMRDTHLPLVTSYFAPAVAADTAGHDRIYSIICDADLNRVWVAKQAWDSRITYFAPCGRAAQRLRAYGVPEERIVLTGFPLPLELLGGPDLSLLKTNLARRLVRLDPEGRFRVLHGKNVEHFLGPRTMDEKAGGPITITYAVGGAGAQMDIGGKIAHSLRQRLESGEVKLNLVAGIREEVRDYFEKVRAGIPAAQDRISVVFEQSIPAYFDAFTALMGDTDILWTKPSELSFYCALGIPIIMTPTIGSQEKFNRRWLHEVQAGMRQEKPDYADQWLFDAIRDGRIAEMAWDGFLKARKLGTMKILEYLETGSCRRGDSPLER